MTFFKDWDCDVIYTRKDGDNCDNDGGSNNHGWAGKSYGWSGKHYGSGGRHGSGSGGRHGSGSGGRHWSGSGGRHGSGSGGRHGYGKDCKPICFTTGTLIATPQGERAVETLKAGDKVVTRDNGLQEIRWVGHSAMSPRAFVESPELKPILIQKGSLGPNLPERDMMVSPNHRMLISNERTSLYFAETEVLVSAKYLVNGRNIRQVDVTSTTYIHMLFDQHEVVLSDGAWTESFQPGDYSLGGLGDEQRNEIFKLFPELDSAAGVANYVAARPSLKRKEAELLTV